MPHNFLYYCDKSIKLCKGFTIYDRNNEFNLFHDLIPPTEGPLEIFANIFFIEVIEINNIELTMTFKVY